MNTHTQTHTQKNNDFRGRQKTNHTLKVNYGYTNAVLLWFDLFHSWSLFGRFSISSYAVYTWPPSATTSVMYGTVWQWYLDGTKCRAANPPDFRGSLLIFRPTLRLYDLAVQTPDFSHVRYVTAAIGDAKLFRQGPNLWLLGLHHCPLPPVLCRTC